MDAAVPTPTIAQTLESTTQRSATRACFTLHVRTDMLAEYLDVHQRVWEDMRQALSNTGWTNYSLFVNTETGMVVGYFESADVQAAMRAMANTDVNSRWQAEMAQYFVQPEWGDVHILPQYFYLA